MHTGASLAATLMALLSFTFTALLLAALEPVRANMPEARIESPQAQSPAVDSGDSSQLSVEQRRVQGSTRPGDAPGDAAVLFDGGGTSAWHQEGMPITWRVEDDVLVVEGGDSIQTVERFGDCQIHLEWATPAEVVGENQGRGIPGVILMERYEIQLLDSFENRTHTEGQAAAVYGQLPPAANVYQEPGAWQSCDIVFEAPRFDGEELTSPARITVFHNGVLVHHAVRLLGATENGNGATYAAHAPELPLVLQGHGDPTRFRNIWLRRL